MLNNMHKLFSYNQPAYVKKKFTVNQSSYILMFGETHLKHNFCYREYKNKSQVTLNIVPFS